MRLAHNIGSPRATGCWSGNKHMQDLCLCRCLRTLLLENNQLTSLPPQLGKNHAYWRGVSRPPSMTFTDRHDLFPCRTATSPQWT